MNPLRKRTAILLSILLALVCIGTVELIVCSYCDPALFDTITAPVVNTAKSAADAARGAANATGQAITDLCDRIKAVIEEAKAKRDAEKLQAELNAAAQAAAQADDTAEIADDQSFEHLIVGLRSIGNRIENR